MLLRLILQLAILAMVALDENGYIIYVLTVTFIMQWMILKPAWSKSAEIHKTEIYKVYRQMELRRLMIVGDALFIFASLYEFIIFILYLFN